MCDFDDIVAAASEYQPVKLAQTDKHLDALFGAISSLGCQNWTYPFGRAYQYEFFLARGDVEDSIIVELSVAARVAAVYYARRRKGRGGEFSDVCSDEPPCPEYGDIRQTLLSLVAGLGYDTVIPYSELGVVRQGKETYKWLFSNPDD